VLNRGGDSKRDEGVDGDDDSLFWEGNATLLIHMLARIFEGKEYVADGDSRQYLQREQHNSATIQQFDICICHVTLTG